MGSFSETVTIVAPPHVVWAALADIGNIAEWNPGVVSSRKTTAGETGVGARRRCELGGRNYLNEEVVEWEPDRALTMRIVGTNLPFKTADIRFTLQGSGDCTAVTVAPMYRLKFGWLGSVLDVIAVRAQYRKGMMKLLHGLKEHVERRAAADTGALGDRPAC